LRGGGDTEPAPTSTDTQLHPRRLHGLRHLKLSVCHADVGTIRGFLDCLVKVALG
jgi:hypothetical protein